MDRTLIEDGRKRNFSVDESVGVKALKEALGRFRN